MSCLNHCKRSVGGLLACMGLWLAAAFLPVDASASPPAPQRPNILLVIADDWGWGHAGVLGDPAVKTPNFDRVAREGVLFQHAYCAAPTCTASRASLLTGQPFYRLKEAAHLHGPLDKNFPVYPDLLEDAGYAVGLSGKGLGPGDFRAGGRSRNPAGPMVKDFTSFLAGLPAEKPFCFWFGSHNPHRPFDQRRLAGTIDPATVSLPPFLPDVPEVRGDLADYFAEVQAFDQELGGLLAALEKAGRLDNTLIVVTSDNGMPFPRAKCNLYASGTRMPLAVRWGARVKPGRVVEDMVSLCDLAPTFLAVAGVSAPAGMTGRSLLGILESDKDGVLEAARDHVVVGRERHGGNYPCRALHTRDFLYIRNYKPELSPAAADAGPAKEYLEEHEADPAVAKCWAAYAGTRPAEELYDNRKDPGQLMNVAADPHYAAVREKLARQLDAELEQTGDPRATGHGDVFDSYPDRSPRHANPRPQASSKLP